MAETTMSSSATRSTRQKVLIVDDDPGTCQVLSLYAADLGLIAESATNGILAMTCAAQAAPDLILLDVVMPVMNGAETLAWLKRDHVLREIPVIMISGLDEADMAVKCIEAGAEDYLTKPIDLRLLRARMRSSLDRARLRAVERAYLRRLETYSVELAERVRQKTKDLAEAHERLNTLDRAKDDFLTLISHELRTPMTGVIGACNALTEGGVDDETRKGAEGLLRGSIARLARIVEDALLLTQIKVSTEAFSLAPHALPPLASAAAQRASLVVGSRGVAIEHALGEPGPVLCDEELLVQALASLYECAVKFSAPGQVVRVEGSRAAESVELRIRANGHNIPASLRPRFFEILSLGGNPLTPGGDLGLGPPVAAQILRLLGGSVEIESGQSGVCFLVRLQADCRART